MSDSYSNEQNKKKIIIISLIVVAIVVIALSITSCNGKKQEEKYIYVEDPSSSLGLKIAQSKEEIIEDLNRKVEQGMMNISMNLCPVFENGISAGNLLIFNDEKNNYPQIVEIYMKDSGEKIYESGGIDVGHAIEYANLSKCLGKGEYPCTAYFTAIDKQTGNPIGKAGADILITVLN